jgi:preprotein translocase subunit SecA
MNTQRKIIYEERRKILTGADTRSNVLNFIRDMIADTVPGYCDARHKDLWDLSGLFEHIGQIVPLPPLDQVHDQLGTSPEAVIDAMYDMVEQAYEAREAEVSPEVLRQIERWIMLRSIDSRWVAYLTTMEHLKDAIGLQGYAQKDPLVEYKSEAFTAFEQLKRDIQFEIATNIFRVEVVRDEVPQPPPQPAMAAVASGPTDTPGTGVADALASRDGAAVPSVATPAAASPMGATPGQAARQLAGVPTSTGAGTAVAAASRPQGKVGRNDPCPCGSGRKYKKCHGR